MVEARTFPRARLRRVPYLPALFWSVLKRTHSLRRAGRDCWRILLLSAGPAPREGKK